MKLACIAGAIAGIVFLSGTGASAEDPPLQGEFHLSGASGLPGTEVSVTLTVRGTGGIYGYTFSIDFDEGVLLATGVDELYLKPDGSEYDYKLFYWNNEDQVPGNAGVDEGFVIAAVVPEMEDPEEHLLPKDTDLPMAALRFGIRPEAPPGTTTEIRFLDGGRGKGLPVPNELGMAMVEAIPPQWYPTEVMIGTRVNIVGDLSLFSRGDANSDGTVDLSDAVSVLGFLFLGSQRPACADAADANDDGAIDLSDPIAILTSLFLTGSGLPQPHGSPGSDPTPDALDCARGAI